MITDRGGLELETGGEGGTDRQRDVDDRHLIDPQPDMRSGNVRKAAGAPHPLCSSCLRGWRSVGSDPLSASWSQAGPAPVFELTESHVHTHQRLQARKPACFQLCVKYNESHGKRS